MSTIVFPSKACITYYILAVIVCCGGGCGSQPNTFTIKDLEDEDPALRIRAIKWAGQTGQEAAVPLLVDRLQEQDITMRFYAISALKLIVGNDYGYDYKSDAASRAAAVERWRKSLRGDSVANPELPIKKVL